MINQNDNNKTSIEKEMKQSYLEYAMSVIIGRALPDVRDGHRKRLREKFLKAGLSGFHDYEVIELLLTLNTPRKDCKEIAKNLLKSFKTLQGVFEANDKELQQIKGLGPLNIMGLKLIKEVCLRYLEKKNYFQKYYKKFS